MESGNKTQTEGKKLETPILKKRKRKKGKSYQKNYQKGYRGEIINLLLTNGILPYKSLSLLNGSTRLYQRTIKKLKTEGLLKEIRRNNYWYVGLRYHSLEDENIKQKIPENYLDYYKKYARQSAHRMSCVESTEPEREFRSIYTNLMMYASGAETTPGKKNLKEEYLEETDCIYYTSKELKAVANYRDQISEKTKTLNNSRIMGLLYSPGGIYSVYNTGENLIEWKRYGENRMQIYLENMIFKKSLKKPEKKGYKKEAIIIANKPEVFHAIITNDRSNKRKQILMNIDYSYDHMFCIPQNKDGIQTLNIMMKKNWKEKIKNSLLSFEEQEDAMYSQTTCDGYDKEKQIYKFIFCIPDMVRLKQFLARAKMNQQRDKYEIYCYTYQLSLLVPLVNRSANIYTIDQKEIIDYFSQT